MISFTLNNETISITPNEEGMYKISGYDKGARRPGSFTRQNNGSWEGQFVSVRGGSNQGTYSTGEMAAAYFRWLGASSVVWNGKEVEVIKAQRAEIEFGDRVVDKMFSNYTVIRQYQILGYRVDFYIPELNIVVEYDEPQHLTQAHKEADAIREAEIKRETGCTFIRVPH